MEALAVGGITAVIYLVSALDDAWPAVLIVLCAGVAGPLVIWGARFTANLIAAPYRLANERAANAEARIPENVQPRILRIEPKCARFDVVGGRAATRAYFEIRAEDNGWLDDCYGILRSAVYDSDTSRPYINANINLRWMDNYPPESPTKRFQGHSELLLVDKPHDATHTIPIALAAKAKQAEYHLVVGASPSYIVEVEFGAKDIPPVTKSYAFNIVWRSASSTSSGTYEDSECIFSELGTDL